MLRSSVARTLAVLVTLIAFAACSDDSPPRSYGDASAGSGGIAAGTGGARATGGIAQTGGTSSGGTSAGGARDAGPDVSEPPTDASDASIPVDASTEAGVRCFGDAGTSGGAYRWHLPYANAFADHVVTDSTGAAIVNGSFTGTLKVGDKTLTSHGSADFHFERVLPAGKVDWARSYGGDSEDYALNLVLDAQDRIYFSGLYNGRGNTGGPDLPVFSGTPGRYWAFVASYTAVGDHRWSRGFASASESDVGGNFAVDELGSVFAAGRFWSTLTFPGVTHDSAGGTDVYFARLDEPEGVVSRHFPLGGTGDDGGGVTAWDGKHVWVAYDFKGTLAIPDFGSVTSAGGSDLLVIELDRDGKVLNAARYGGAGDERVIDGVWTGTHFVLTGQTNSAEVAFRTGEPLTTRGANDVFVVAVAPSLDVSWAKVFGSTAEDRPREIAAGPCGELALTGEFRESMTIGDETLTATPASGGGPTAIDAFVVKMTPEFAPLWAHSFGSPLPDRGLGIAFDPDGGVYLTVAFQGSVDFGGGSVAPGGEWGSAVVSLSP